MHGVEPKRAKLPAATGLRMLKKATGGNKELARKLIRERGFIIPEE